MTWLIAVATMILLTSVAQAQAPRVVMDADGKGRIIAYGPQLQPADAAALVAKTVRPLAPVPPPPLVETLPWPARPVIYRPGDGPFGSFPEPMIGRPLNCCGTYSIPLPYPTVRIILDRERTPTAGVSK